MSAEANQIVELTAVVVSGLIGAVAARSLRLPALAGYLVVGAALGPAGFGLLSDTVGIRAMAEFGVILLMFTLGAELSLHRLAQVRPVALLAAPFEILGAIAAGYAVGRWIGWSAPQAVVLGFILSLSSTMVVVKLLSVRGELHTQPGETMVAILLMQDLAAVLMVAVLPALSGLGQRGELSLLPVLGKGIAFIVWVIILARWIAPAVMRITAQRYSKEVFVVLVAALCLGGAASSYWLGFSVALGAFAAGLVISESRYSHEALASAGPLRDLFGMVFFVSLGFLSDVRGLWTHLPLTLALLWAILIIKPVITAAGVLLAGRHLRTAIVSGLGLAQIGEFSFLVATLALQQRLLTPDMHSLIVAVASLSLIATPGLLRLGEALYGGLRDREAAAGVVAGPATPAGAASPLLAGHVILCGYGRVGRLIGETLLREGHPFAVIDYDQRVVAEMHARGTPVVYGDAANAVVLAAAGPPRAELAVVALPDTTSTRLAVRALRRANSGLRIVARVHLSADVERMYQEGADEVVFAEFEASLELLRHALLHLGHPADTVQANLDGVRGDRYRTLTENGVCE